MKQAQIEDIYPLSPLQEGFLFESLYDSDSQAYFIQMTFRFLGRFQRDIFEKSWNILCSRHAILRTAFVHEDQTRPLQVVLKERKPDIHFMDLSDMSGIDQQERLTRFKQQDRERGFDLQRDVLIRISVFRLQESLHQFVLSYPHILIDGWSLGILQREFFQIYTALSYGEKPDLPAVAPYREYIRWLEKQDKGGAWEYWSQYLAGYEHLATLPKFAIPDKTLAYTAREITFELTETVSRALEELATDRGVTLSTVMQSIWGLLLARYNGIEDVVFGSIVSGRLSELNSVEDMVGLFINTLPVRIQYNAEQPFEEVLQAVQKAFLESQPYQYFPLAEIQTQIPMGRELFDHLLIFENYPVDQLLNQRDPSAEREFTIEMIEVHDRTHYDFDITVVPGKHIQIKLSYNANVYQHEQIERIAGHIQTAIHHVLQDPNQTIKNIQILPDWEQQQLSQNTQYYVLDGHQCLLPVGVPGELYIEGEEVIRSYLNQQDLIVEKFVLHPFKSGERLYKTGEFARWLPNGHVEFLGHRDDHIQIRGYCIKPQEIENQLLRLRSVKKALVRIKESDSSKELVAYIERNGAWDVSDIREHLQITLPDHMIPSYFVKVERFAITPDGKVDSNALPDLSDDQIERGTPHISPRNNTESQLIEIWRKILQTNPIGIHDNFFELGGHSLKAMQIVSRTHRDLGVKINLRDFFNNPTVAGLASLIKTTEESSFSGIHPAPQQEYYDLSHAQQRLWILHQMGREAAVAYNMPEAYLFEGTLERDALNKAFTTLIERHEVLRTAFVEVRGEPKQKICPHLDFRIKEIDLSTLDNAEERAREIAEQDAITPFDLTKPPLFRATAIKLDEKKYVFVLTMHHIIGDGWSMVVFYRELQLLYDAYHRGMPNPLKPLRIQYKDFALWQNEKGFEQDEQYWRKKLSGMPEMVRLPYDLVPESTERGFRGDMEELILEADIVKKLRKLALRKNTTLSNIILTIFKLFLFRLSKQNDLCVGMAIANRNYPDIEHLIGFFVNMLPIRTHLSENMDFDELLQEVIQNIFEAFEHQDYPFDLLVQRLNPNRYANRQPILNVIYGFQSYADITVDLEGEFEFYTLHDGDDANPDQLKDVPLSFKTSKFDLTLFVSDTGENLHLYLEYDTNLFLSESIKKYLLILKRFARMVTEYQK